MKVKCAIHTLTWTSANETYNVPRHYNNMLGLNLSLP